MCARGWIFGAGREAGDMPDIHISEDQRNRLDRLRSSVAAGQAGTYATVTDADLVEYLLDLADAVDDPDALLETEAGSGDAGTSADAPPADPDPDDGDGGGKLEEMMNLLETHREKWREADGEAPYEVDLPDGDVEPARTKDDVKALLFRHYQ